MATPVFANPFVKSRDTGKAPKIPGKVVDPELGEVVQRSDSPLEVAEKPVKYNPKNALFPEATALGLVGKGKKSRKQKKRVHKKTQKRRARK